MRSGDDREAVTATLDALEGDFDRLASLSWGQLTHSELLNVQSRLETLASKLPAISRKLICRLMAEASPSELGGSSWANVLATRLRISPAEARRRIAEAEDLGERTTLTGELLEPRLPNTAAAHAAGSINTEHVKVIRSFFSDLPDAVDIETRSKAEAHLARIATGLGPTQLRQAADRLAYLLNQDGSAPTDTDRARRRYLTLGRQGIDGMSELRGLLDPEARATLDAVLAKWAAPGMCNPDDETPCVDGEPAESATQNDLRSQGQRNHDGLKAMGRSVLASGQLAQHNGLPATIIVSTTLKELESAAGQAVTAGGSLLPMPDLIRLASHAHHYLVVFDNHTQTPLYLGRSKRLASPGQRIVLHARDRGCTRPGCTCPGYWCQAHHDDGWAAGDAPTDIDKLSLACGPDNRLVEEGGWTIRKRHDGRTEWIPPPHLDTGQTRVNDYHHPENYLVDDDSEDDPG
ncbi:MAG: HNH endonuclease signature motif containing protein [Mycobacterium sp.]